MIFIYWILGYLAKMEFDHSSDDSVDQRKLKLSIKQEIDDCQQLTSKAKTKKESDINHSNQNSHHHDWSAANEWNINEVKLKPSKSFWPMAKKILISSDEIADLRLSESSFLNTRKIGEIVPINFILFQKFFSNIIYLKM